MLGCGIGIVSFIAFLMGWYSRKFYIKGKVRQMNRYLEQKELDEEKTA
jgi:hypothetical protein